MGHNTHEDVAHRWRERALGISRPALRSRNLHDEGDAIYSYGHHFEVGRILRDEKRHPVAWLLNGDTASVTTSRHQREVRSAVQGYGLPVVTIPHSALDAAGVDLATVQIIDVQADWSTETVITKTEMPGRWQYDYPTRDDQGGWVNSRTGEFVGKVYQWDYSGKPRQETCEACKDEPRPKAWSGPEWEAHLELKAARETHIRLRHGVWGDVPPSTRKTGRKRVVSGANGSIVWDLVDDPEAPLGYVFERVQNRHWLGASLIRAAVNEPIMRRHERCGGTGQGERWYQPIRAIGHGPLDEETTRHNAEHWAMQQERYEKRGYWYQNGELVEDYPPVISWSVETYSEHTECRGCSGRGRVPATRRRWAYYLSGFDLNETRPSYFFCELPKSSPATVEEAYEVLKPDSVKLAETMGRDVKRQGDIFAIPMPTAETRLLKRDGDYRRMPKRDEVNHRAGDTADIPYLLDTNHAATEVVVLGGQTYARGMLTHAPAWRAPDHRRVKLGNEWHLIIKNTVPVAV